MKIIKKSNGSAAPPRILIAGMGNVLRRDDGFGVQVARRLEEAGYVTVSKSFVDRTPQTRFKLTAAGRRALSDYLDQMEAIIRLARG